MPADDVSDLRDVVDAINRLCDTMKTSQYDEVYDDSSEPDATEGDSHFEESPRPIATEIARTRDFGARDVYPAFGEAAYPAMETSDLAAEILECIDIVSPEEVSIRTIEVQERWSDSLMSLPVETLTSDTEPVAQCEPASEMYYTASSEVSLLSDTEVPEKAGADDDSLEGKERDERKECVIAGHVAAMRERFESMTRTNTPCPDLMRSASPSLDVFRNITPSPDRLG